MRVKLKGVNKVRATLSGGKVAFYYYHRATGTRLAGEPGTAEFIASIAEAQRRVPDRGEGTLSTLIRKFENTNRWKSKLASSTKLEYRRVFTFWDSKYGTVPYAGLEEKQFRQDVLEWHSEFAETKPREADNRVTILARVLSWGATDGPLKVNVLGTFERAYTGDRSDLIWLPEHVNAFLEVADPEMQLAMVLALHTGQRQADIRRMAWSNFDGRSIVIRQGKSARDGKPGRLVTIPCTGALRATLEALPKRGLLIMPTKTGKAFTKRYFGEKWEKAALEAGITNLHFHDIRGTTVTLLFEAGCTVAEAASITGHTLRRAQEILDRYLSRTAVMAESAIAKFERYGQNDSRISRSALIRSASGGGTVYFVKAGNRVKIGFTTDLGMRLGVLQTSSPEPLELIHHMPGTIGQEKELHLTFANLGVGGEWFKLEGALELYLRQYLPHGKDSA